MCMQIGGMWHKEMYAYGVLLSVYDWFEDKSSTHLKNIHTEKEIVGHKIIILLKRIFISQVRLRKMAK